MANAGAVILGSDPNFQPAIPNEGPGHTGNWALTPNSRAINHDLHAKSADSPVGYALAAIVLDKLGSASP